MDLFRSLCRCFPIGTSPFTGQYSAVIPTNTALIKMSECEECDTRFTLLKRKRTCTACQHNYCSACMKKGKASPSCQRCQIFNSFPLNREAISGLKVRHLRWFLDKNRISIQGCKEKRDIVDLVMHHASLRNATFAYPQNYERHTIRTEDMQEERPSTSPVFRLSHNQSIPNVTSTPNRAGPSPRETLEFVEEEDDGFTLISVDDNIGPLPGQSDTLQDTEHEPPGETVPETTPAGGEPNAEQEKGGNKAEASTFNTLSINDITSVDQISTLSVMQLKLILTRNYVGFKGCCEKQELQQKVCNLWIKKQESKDVDKISDENLCKICMEAAIDSVLLDCGHLVSCTECGKRLHECPICRQYVVRVVHTFKA